MSKLKFFWAFVFDVKKMMMSEAQSIKRSSFFFNCERSIQNGFSAEILCLRRQLNGYGSIIASTFPSLFCIFVTKYVYSTLFAT
jgi:hypothetical protein